MSLLLAAGAASSGAIAGTCSITFGQSGALAGSGVLAGTTLVVFGQTGSMLGAGILAGTSPLVFGQVGALVGAGALAGTTPLVFGASGTADLPQGALVGTATLVFGQIGTLSSTGGHTGGGSVPATVSGRKRRPRQEPAIQAAVIPVRQIPDAALYVVSAFAEPDIKAVAAPAPRVAELVQKQPATAPHYASAVGVTPARVQQVNTALVKADADAALAAETEAREALETIMALMLLDD